MVLVSCLTASGATAQSTSGNPAPSARGEVAPERAVRPPDANRAGGGRQPDGKRDMQEERAPAPTPGCRLRDRKLELLI